MTTGKGYIVLQFQSTLPARGSDVTPSSYTAFMVAFQSTLPARGSDAGLGSKGMGKKVFQSTLPARGSDKLHRKGFYFAFIFQSTLPARGSDCGHTATVELFGHFNPRSPQGGATREGRKPLLLLKISIHAPRKGERQARLAAIPA